MKKKTVTVLSFMLAVMLLLSACGVSQPKPSGGAAPGQAVESNDEPGDPFGVYNPPITLRGSWVSGGTIVYIPGNPDYDSTEKNMYMQAYADLGINVTFDWISADTDAYNTKWTLAMAQKNLPDFGMVNAAQYKMLVDAGLCMDMTDIFEKYASDKYKNFLAADGGIVRGYSTWDGRLLGLPYTGATPDNIVLMFIRQDWLDQLMLPIPTTIEELEKTAKAFMDAGLAEFGIISCKTNASGNDNTLRGVLNGYGAQMGWWLKGADGKLYYSSTGSEMKEPLLKLREMYANKLINQDFAVTDINATREMLAAGKSGIVFGPFSLATGIRENIAADEKAVWTTAEIPTVDGKPKNGFVSASASSFLFVNVNCKNPEAVVKIVNTELELMFSEDPEISAKYTTHPHPDGSGASIQSSKYVATVNIMGMPWQNLTRHMEATAALETGVEKFSIALSKTTLTNFQKYLDGDRGQYAPWIIFGPGPGTTFSIIRQYKENNRLTYNEYQALPTETMTEKSALLDDALWAAAVKVIVGEDYSVYEKEVQNWFANGGQTITDEVNAWYAGNK